MSAWRRFVRGVRALVARDTAERDLRDEVEHYVEEAANVHLATGLSAHEARRAALLEVGGVDAVTERMRAAGWEGLLVAVLSDVRYAARRMRASSGFAVLAVLILAVGVGAATTIFSVLHPILLDPLPYRDADRIVSIWEVGSDGLRVDGTFGMYVGLSERSTSFETLAVHRDWRPTIAFSDRSERLIGQRVSAGYFDVLGVAPARGVTFDSTDDRPGGRNVVVLSDRLWRDRFGADPAVIGGEVLLDGTAYLVSGVMPRAFENVGAPAAELWAPLQYDMSQGRAWGHHLRMVARLRPAVDAGVAVGELDDLGARVLEEQRPETYGTDVQFGLATLQADVARTFRPALLAMFAAVALLLVIACVNAANLALARATHRRGELALRAALGASRGRLIRQLLTESLLLSILAGAVGLALAAGGVRALVALAPPGLPRVDAIALDGSVFAFALLLTVLTGIAFGLVPALHAARGATHAAIQHGSPRVAGTRSRARNVLVVAQVSLALVLLVGSGLLFRSLNRLFAVDAGFDPDDVLTMQLHAVGTRFDGDAAVHRYFDEMLDAVRRVPGVASAALTNQLPLSGDLDLYGVRFDPPRTDDPGEIRGSFRYAVSTDYLQTMGIPLRTGRLLTDEDRADAARVAVVSEALVRRRLGGLDPIGKRLRIGPAAGAPFTIVGVAGDVRQESLALTDADAVYVPAHQWHFADDTRTVVVRARGSATSLVPAVRAAILSVDRHQPITRIATLDELVARSAAERRFALLVFQAFAAAALLLAAGGIYAVLSAAVAERARELAVRSVLGARRGMLLALVLRQGMSLTAAGIAIGLLGGLAAGRAIGALLFGISPLDPVTYVAVALTMAAVALIACAIPALRAARIEPARTLGAE